MSFPIDSIDDYFDQLGDDAQLVYINDSNEQVSINGIKSDYLDGANPIKVQVNTNTLKFMCSKSDAAPLKRDQEVHISDVLHKIVSKENREKICTLTLKLHKE